MRELLEDFQEEFDVFVSVLDDNLEGTEQLGGEEFSLFLSTEVLNGNFDRCGLIGAIFGWNLMVSERLASKEKLSSVQLEDSIDVCFDLLVIP